MLKSKTMQWVIAVLLIFLLVSCSAGKTEDGKSEAGTEIEGTEQPGTDIKKPNDSENSDEKLPALDQPEEITIYYMWGGYPRDMFMSDYGDYMVKKYPNLSINYIQNEGENSLTNLITAGTNIDLILTADASYYQLKELGLQGNISDLEKKYNYDSSQIHTSVYEMMKTINDGSNAPGLPFKVNALGFFYNKDLFDKFALDYPTDHMTWDQIYELAKSLTRMEGDTNYRGLGFRNGNVLSMNQLSLPLANTAEKKAVIETDPWKNYLNTLARFLQLPSYNPTAETFAGVPYEQFVKDETLAMLIQMNSDWPRKERGIDINWDAVTYPSFPSQPDFGPQANIVFFALPDTSKNRDAAFLAMAAVTDKEKQLESAKIGSAPVLHDASIMDVYGSEDPDLKTRNAKALIPQNYAATTLNELSSLVTGQVWNAFRETVLGEKDLNTALRDANEMATKAIEEHLAMTK